MPWKLMTTRMSCLAIAPRSLPWRRGKELLLKSGDGS
jgi:hypothetical protein